ncbi:MAG: heat-inducible transcription repressor HrcA [Nitrospirae bacterium]|nr:heat-inducible transcription repressor HrcA [Nitrospirota bacterium]
MDERTKKILIAVIQSYIQLAAPVGSRYISKKYGLGVSPATIRNAMSDLEEMGYLSQPHASSGRMPTDKGYRLFVEEIRACNVSANDDLLTLLSNNNSYLMGDLNDFLYSITRALSNYSRYLVVTLSSTMEKSRLKKIDLSNLRDNVVVVLLFTEEGMVKHKMVESKDVLTQDDLTKIASYLNSQFRGYTLGDIRKALLDIVYQEMAMRDDLVAVALNLCKNAIYPCNLDVFISGISALIESPDFCDIQKIKELSKAVDDKQKIITLLDKMMESEGVQVYIGTESFLDTEELSLVASTFCDKGRPFGVLGLIGPQRMDYASVISIVDTSARFLSNHLQGR